MQVYIHEISTIIIFITPTVVSGVRFSAAFVCLSASLFSAWSMYNNWIVNMARGVAYVGGRTGEGRAQAAGADGQRSLATMW